MYVFRSARINLTGAMCRDYRIGRDAVSICEAAIASFSRLANAACTGKFSANSTCFVRISFARCASWAILVDAALLQVPLSYYEYRLVIV